MKPGDLVKIMLKDGAISCETGILFDVGEYGWVTILVNKKLVSINILDYNMEVINA